MANISSSNSKLSQLTDSSPPPGLFITDLDGTLFRSDRTASKTDLETLRNLGKKGFIRAIATGRSLYSFKKAVGDTLPVDYVIFSTGAGILRYPHGELLRKTNLKPDTVKSALQILLKTNLDLMVHRPVPDNHMFAYWGNKKRNSDFAKRIELYKEYCWPLNLNDGFHEAAQFLAIVDEPGVKETIDLLRTKLPDLNIVRTTSPLDGKSTWIEVFDKRVSKSRAAEWLAAQLKISLDRTLAIGNDYNDEDMLEWAGICFVVDNAPEHLKKKYPAVASNNDSGVTEAANRWLKELSI
jgi:Cof subfamily protein (haloacid dehalogenase superfamily)